MIFTLNSVFVRATFWRVQVCAPLIGKILEFLNPLKIIIPEFGHQMISKSRTDNSFFQGCTRGIFMWWRLRWAQVFLSLPLLAEDTLETSTNWPSDTPLSTEQLLRWKTISCFKKESFLQIKWVVIVVFCSHSFRFGGNVGCETVSKIFKTVTFWKKQQLCNGLNVSFHYRGLSIKSSPCGWNFTFLFNQTHCCKHKKISHITADIV